MAAQVFCRNEHRDSEVRGGLIVVGVGEVSSLLDLRRCELPPRKLVVKVTRMAFVTVRAAVSIGVVIAVVERE